MGAQSPFDKSAAKFIIHRVKRGDRDYAAVYFLASDDGSSINIDAPIAVCAAGPSKTNDPQWQAAVEQMRWLVGGAAAFHDVEVHDYLDDPVTPRIKQRPSTWKTGG